MLATTQTPSLSIATPQGLPLDSEFLGISGPVFSANVRFVQDLTWDEHSHEVLETPIADALALRYTRFGQQAKENQRAALFIGHDGEVWQAKIFGEFQNGRSGQYLAPKGIGDRPFVPSLPTGMNWDTFKTDTKIPLLLTEGGKKALASVSQGVYAVAAFGVDCGKAEGRVKETFRPWVEGRVVYLAFDQDSKATTRFRVAQALWHLGNALTFDGKSQVFVVEWPPEEGKGIDDLIANDPAKFHQAIRNAVPFERWKQARRQKPLSETASRIVQERYFPGIAVPESARLVSIQSGKGTGKTHWLAEQVKAAIADGHPVLVLGHREQLMKELANRFGIPYRTETTPEGRILGYALCIDSAHPLANPAFRAEFWEDSVVIIDEAMQVLWHLLNADTLAKKRRSILNSFLTLLRVAHRVYLSDADLDSTTVQALQDAMGLDNSQCFGVVNEYQQQGHRSLLSYDSPEALTADLLASLENNDKVLVSTGAQKAKSRWGSIALERLLKSRFPHLKILRLDSETVSDPSHAAFGVMGNLNEIIPLYDVIIASPTLETGVSIDVKHFDRQFIYAVGSQTVEAVCQTAERIRDDIPRHLWAKKISSQRIGNGSTNPKALLESQHNTFKANCQILSIIDVQAHLDGISSHWLEWWAEKAAWVNCGYKYYRDSILDKFREEGYNISEPLAPDNLLDIKQAAICNSAQVYDEEVAEIVAAPLLDEPTYNRLKDKQSKTQAERYAERKTALSKQYMTSEITPDLIKADDDGLYGKLRLHYYLTVGRPYLPKRDRKKIEAISEAGEAFIPDFNRNCLSAQVAALQALDIHQFFDSERLFTAESLAEWFERAKLFRRDIKRYLKQSIGEKDTAIGLAQRLLGLLGLKLTYIKRGVDENGNRARYYQMLDLDSQGRSAIFERWLEQESIASTPINK